MNRCAIAVLLICMTMLFAPRCLVQVAAADVIYDTFRSDGGFRSTSGYFVHNGEPFGARFVTGSSSFLLDTVDLALQSTHQNQLAPLAAVYVTVRTNTALDEPGEILETMHREDIKPGPVTFQSGTYSFVSTLRPLLEPNTPYWIVVDNPLTNLVQPFWFGNVLNVHDPVVEFNTAGNTWKHYQPQNAISPAMRIQATAVPEPPTLALAALGALGLLIGGGCKR